jgi:hypothetical protein
MVPSIWNEGFSGHGLATTLRTRRVPCQRSHLTGLCLLRDGIVVIGHCCCFYVSFRAIFPDVKAPGTCRSPVFACGADSVGRRLRSSTFSFRASTRRVPRGRQGAFMKLRRRKFLHLAAGAMKQAIAQPHLPDASRSASASVPALCCKSAPKKYPSYGIWIKDLSCRSASGPHAD